MSKKRKRKFMLSIVLVLLVKSSKANGDLFAEGFMLNPLPQKTPKCRPYGSYGPKLLPIWRRGPKTMLNANKNSGNKNLSYYCSEFDCKFFYNQLQAKFKHAFRFGIEGNYNSANRKLFLEALINHMRRFKPRPGTYHGIEVNHYLDPNTGLNVMINTQTKRFLSGWKLNEKQLKQVLDHGNLGSG